MTTGSRSIQHPKPSAIVLVGVGGTVGTLFRLLLTAPAGTTDLLGVWLANTLGAFVLMYGTTVATRRSEVLRRTAPLWATGLLGSFTTYSALAVAAQWWWLPAHLITGLLAALAGAVAAQKVHSC